MNRLIPEIDILKKNWVKLGQISIWITSIIFTFQTAPPRLNVTIVVEKWDYMARFLVALLLGIIIALSSHHPRKRKIWLYASAIFLILGTTVFFVNIDLTDRWTCPYDGREPMVIGHTLTPEGSDYFLQRPYSTCTRALQDFAGNNIAVWKSSEISQRFVILLSLFFVSILAYSLSAILLLQSFISSKTEDTSS